MKLTPKTTFDSFYVPSMGIELSAGRFVFTDKEFVGVIELKYPGRVYVFHRRLIETQAYFVMGLPR